MFRSNKQEIQGLLEINYYDRLRFSESILSEKFDLDIFIYNIYTQFHSISNTNILVKKRQDCDSDKNYYYHI